MEFELGSRLLSNLRNVNGAMAKIMHRMFNPLNISPVQGMVLSALHKNGGTMNLSALAENMFTPASNITKIVERLEKSGCLKRQRGLDRRNAYVSLTDEGKEMLNAFKDRREALMKDVKLNCSDDEFKAILNSLEKLEQILFAASVGFDDRSNP